MAKINRPQKGSFFRALWTPEEVKKDLEKRFREWQNKVVLTLQREGEAFVNRARDKTPATGGFTDRTGNLRSSIGYMIVRDGEIIDTNFQASPRGTDPSGGISQGVQFASLLSKAYPSGIVLIGVAGMHYARYVEDMGYDVITGSAPDDDRVKQLLVELKVELPT